MAVLGSVPSRSVHHHPREVEEVSSSPSPFRSRNDHLAIFCTHLKKHHVTESPRGRGLGGEPGPGSTASPESLKEAGLSPGFLCDMLLRTLYTRGPMLGRDLAQFLCLPFKVIREPLRFLKDEKCIQVDGGDLVGEVSYKFSLTDLGRKRAQDAMEQCAYVGPAPVPLEDYVEQCYRQTVTGLQCYPEALQGTVRPPGDQRGDVQQHRAGDHQRPVVFIYGPPGNGKTAMARAIGDFMNTDGRLDLHPLRVRRRRQHHHRLRPVAARHRRHAGRVRGRSRRDGPQTAHHGVDGSALGAASAAP